MTDTETDRDAAHFALEPDERLLWRGQPQRWLYDPFGVKELAFGVAFLVAAVHTLVLALPAVALAFLLPMAAFLLGIRPWMRARRRRNTFYYVTTRRLVWVEGTFWLKGFSMPLQPSLPIEIAERADGTGTLRFGDAPDRECKVVYFHFFPAGERIGLPSFESIPDVRAVHDLIKRQIDNAAS